MDLLIANMPKLIADLLDDMHSAGLVSELVAVVLSAAVAWLLSRQLRRRFPESFASTALVLPLVALVCVAIAHVTLARREPVPLLHLLQALLATWLIVRASAGLLLHVFPNSAPLRVVANFGKWVIWIIAALYVLGWLDPMTDYLDTVMLPFGKPPVSLLSVLQAALAVGVTLLGALWLSAWLEARVLKTDAIDHNLRLVLTKLVRAAMLVAAVLVALSYAGIPLTALSVFGGALGVGLGLGLQRLAANYVSGFVILLDGSIKVGDNVRVDTFEGQVTGINTRYTTVRSPNGRESIVPNELLVSSRVENLSLADPNVLCTMVVGVAYDDKVDAALRILENAALTQPRVLRAPGPLACITSFAPDGFELTLMFWINDPQNGQVSLKGAIYREVWSRFQEAGIEVPYPQRVLRGLPLAAEGQA
ncbi:MAG: mechanosensitive ion channel [Betaproteobacteria bacterium]|nr:mechanosensitive ion channel [Betaproteobacteria bacterium]